MTHGHEQRQALNRLREEARAGHETARDLFRMWRARDSYPFHDDRLAVHHDDLARAFTHSHHHSHPVWRLVLTTGRVNAAGEPCDESLLAPVLLPVCRATNTCADWTCNVLYQLLDRGCRVAPDTFRVDVRVVIDRLVLDLLHLRLAVHACEMIGRFNFSMPPRGGYGAMADGSAALTCTGRTRLRLEEADQLLAAVARAVPVRALLSDGTRRLLNACRLEYATARYDPDPVMRRADRVPFVLSGRMEGEIPDVVRAGLARTFALSRGTDFPDEPPVMSGVLADWEEDRGGASESLLEDLRAAPTTVHCPSLTTERYWRERDEATHLATLFPVGPFA